ncbi:unannotated protein [freshwater metagenome]|uniref:Unannotated protein n=1 Tax=freshwater metagenome TaxID=449393 RepID=A0A6J7FI22_9ZZZZ|nr:hypothetical protein [Actinomycetota bacterium]
MSTLLASSQNRDVAVSVIVGGQTRDLGIADKHSPGEVKNEGGAHYPGGNTGWRVLYAKPGVDDGSLEFTFDPDTDGWKLDVLTQAAAEKAPISIVDVYRSPGRGVVMSRKHAGFVGSFQEAESDATESNAQTLTVAYTPSGLPTS